MSLTKLFIIGSIFFEKSYLYNINVHNLLLVIIIYSILLFHLKKLNVLNIMAVIIVSKALLFFLFFIGNIGMEITVSSCDSKKRNGYNESNWFLLSHHCPSIALMKQNNLRGD